jgi:hypothetical protein
VSHINKVEILLTPVTSISLDMLRKKLWKGFIDSSNYNVESDDAHGMISCGKHDNNSVQNSISTIKKSLDSIKDYLPERFVENLSSYFPQCT